MAIIFKEYCESRIEISIYSLVLRYKLISYDKLIFKVENTGLRIWKSKIYDIYGSSWVPYTCLVGLTKPDFVSFEGQKVFQLHISCEKSVSTRFICFFFFYKIDCYFYRIFKITTVCSQRFPTANLIMILRNFKISTSCEMEKDKEVKGNVRNEHRWSAWNCLEIVHVLLKNVPREAPQIMWTCRTHSRLTNVGFQLS